ncbi:MAG: SEL1-like repeat protein [Methylococcaceae bacterium]
MVLTLLRTNNSGEVDDQDEGESDDYHILAEQGNAEAHFELAKMHYIGGGVQEDDEKAVFWYRKAAHEGGVVSDDRNMLEAALH